MDNTLETTISEEQSEPIVVPSDSEPSVAPLSNSDRLNPLERLTDGIVKVAPAFFTLLAFWLAVQGQSFFNIEPIQPFNLRSGMIRFGLATLFLLLARVLYWMPKSFNRTALKASSTDTPLDPLAELFSPARMVMTMLGFLLMVNILSGLAKINPLNPEVSSFAFYFWGWLLASALVALPWLYIPEMSQVGQPSGLENIPRRLINWVVAYRWALLGVMLITLLATWLRLNNLANAPFTINGDEGSIGLDVLKVLKGELRHPFILMWGTHSSLVAFILAIPARFVGLSIGSLRLMHALICILAIPALFILTRRITNSWVALVAAFFLATFPMHIHYSRVAVGAGVWDSFFYTATFAAFVWGMRPEVNHPAPFVLAGLLGGLGQYAYTGSRLLPILLILFIGYLALLHINLLQQKWTALLLMALVFTVVASPHYLHLSRFPDDANVRLNEVGIIQNGWLSAEAERRGESKTLILWEQFRRSLFGFAYFDDNSETWHPNSPLAPTLFSIGLFLGLIVSLRHWREPPIVLMHLWFWGILLTGGMLTLDPPTSNRLVGITPVVCFFAALGWDAVAQALAPSFPMAQWKDGLISGWAGGGMMNLSHLTFFVILASLTGYSGVWAHQQYLADNNFGGTNARIATHIGYELATYPADTSLIMLGAPRIWSNISPLLFLTPNYARQDIIEPLSAPPTNLPPHGDLMFVVLPERAGEMGFIQQIFPNKMQEVYDSDKNELIYYEIMVDR